MMIDRFEDQPEQRWRFFSDQVMGGVSTGQAQFLTDAGTSYVQMTGDVSTANNGGFIQIRTELADAAPDDAQGVRLVVRGNNQRYFIHLRTRGTMLPWQYYQSGFEAGADWVEVKLPFASFEPSGGGLRATPTPDSLKSVGIVAYGRDHAAEIAVRDIRFY